MFTLPMSLQTESVAFKVAQRGRDHVLGIEHEANCKEFPVWVQWGEPGAKHYHAKSVKFCLN